MVRGGPSGGTAEGLGGCAVMKGAQDGGWEAWRVGGGTCVTRGYPQGGGFAGADGGQMGAWGCTWGCTWGFGDVDGVQMDVWGCTWGCTWGFGDVDGVQVGVWGCRWGCRWGFGGADGIRDADRGADGGLGCRWGFQGGCGGGTLNAFQCTTRAGGFLGCSLQAGEDQHPPPPQKSHLPKIYQALLMSATFNPDVEALQELVLHNPVSGVG